MIVEISGVSSADCRISGNTLVGIAFKILIDLLSLKISYDRTFHLVAISGTNILITSHSCQVRVDWGWVLFVRWWPPSTISVGPLIFLRATKRDV